MSESGAVERGEGGHGRRLRLGVRWLSAQVGCRPCRQLCYGVRQATSRSQNMSTLTEDRQAPLRDLHDALRTAQKVGRQAQKVRDLLPNEPGDGPSLLTETHEAAIDQIRQAMSQADLDLRMAAHDAFRHIRIQSAMCECYISCDEDDDPDGDESEWLGCSLAGEPHVHAGEPCPVHPDAPGDR